MCAYPDIETASAATGPDAAPPLIEERYSITGNDFLALAAQLESPTGAGKPYSQCVYDHFRAKVPRFANAVDVDPIGG
ncbi:hypothetical protein [Gemmata obscuriglobus]|uniref:Uncharacterized protein n=1 Tax=Gemmata obscuriglobus TaxID=114 RepID=A0A2Z3H6N0_9BACT|nr:hypothetical protein [Gemmata obscuriglobus]AWM38685.1 hypothetical protein C1280_17960 [Gemmata obscuriglobus]